MGMCMYGYESSGLVKDFHLEVFGGNFFFFFKPELGEVIKITCCTRRIFMVQQIRRYEAEQ